jgi:3-oxoacyl-[acyl-carrier protein] reductase
VAREGVDLVINGRTAADLHTAVAELKNRHGVEVTGVCGDSATADVQEQLLAACPEPDIVLINGAGPLPSRFGAIEDDALRQAYEQAVIGPARFLRRVVPGMRERRFGRIVAVSSAMVKSPSPMMGVSVGTRLGLTGMLTGLSKEVVVDNVTVNQLLPERFDTGRQEQMAELAMQAQGISYEEARARQVASIKAGRLGRAEEFGDTFAFLCSAQAGYLSGQNIQLDGGSYEGVF